MNKKLKKNKTIGLLGLANVGKSTIFNLLLPKISEKQDIGNWSGVTLDTRKSKIDFFSKKIQFIDAPGSVFMENIEINKKETLNYVFGSKCDFFINIVNGLHLEENLYFTLILKEMGIPFLMIINFADRIDKNVHINIQKLENFFNTKILITSAIKNYSKKQIKKFIFNNINFEFQKKTFFYSDKITKLNKKIQICLKNNNNFSNYVKKVKIKSSFFLPHISFKIIQKNDVILKLVKDNDFDYLKINKIIANFEKENSLQCDRNLIFRREKLLSNILNEATNNIKKNSNSIKWTLFLDKIFLNRFFGLPIMILILFLGFVLIFNFSVPTKDFLSDIFVIYLPALFHLNTNTWYGNFIEKAIFNSLGIMFSFLPILYSLFFIISIVKQTGLMSRISFMFEGMFNKIGLNGKSIIPLFLGLGCNVTSVFATRIIKNPNQRKATALMAPFISCSARIIVFSLFATIFFPGFSMLIIISLYAIGIIFAILLGYILKLFFWYKNKDLTTKNIKSLPQYNKIKFRIIFKMVNKNIIGYIKGIFSVIFFFITILWFLNYFPMHSESNQNVSILSHFTHFFKIIFGPLGFGVWGALCISLIPAIVAKETTVAAIILLLLGEHSTSNVSLNMFFCSLLHTIENSFIYLLPNHWFNNELFNTSINGGIADAIRRKINSQACGIYSAGKINLAIYSYMCFILLTIPCITTLGAIYKEFNLKTMIQSLLLGIFVPYLFSLFIFQIGNLLIK